MQETLIDSQAEIGALLKQLSDANVTLSLSTLSGASVIASIWTIDASSDLLRLSVGGQESMLQPLLGGVEVVAVGYIDSIKVQFHLENLALARGESDLALNASFPKRLLRFQRRDSFRVRPLMNARPIAVLRHPDRPTVSLELRVLDVSIGGVALLLPDTNDPIAEGARIPRAMVSLDGDTRFQVDLTVRRVSQVGEDVKGNKGTRLGCEFVRLGGQDERALQRYIDLTQRRRRMLAL